MLKRPRVLLAGAAVLAISLLAAMSAFATTAQHHRARHVQSANGTAPESGGGLPVTAIENALQITGTMSNGVLSEGFDPHRHPERHPAWRADQAVV